MTSWRASSARATARAATSSRRTSSWSGSGTRAASHCASSGRRTTRVPDGPDLAELFDGPVVPEATPSPRTVRFATPALGEGPSRAFDRTNCADDPRVGGIFAAFDEVTSVLVGPNFVAVTILHANGWEQLLARMLAAVTDAFVAAAPPRGPEADAPTVLSLGGSG